MDVSIIPDVLGGKNVTYSNRIKGENFNANCINSVIKSDKL